MRLWNANPALLDPDLGRIPGGGLGALTGTELIQPGATLRLGPVYTVKYGDTLTAIAGESESAPARARARASAGQPWRAREEASAPPGYNRPPHPPFPALAAPSQPSPPLPIPRPAPPRPTRLSCRPLPGPPPLLLPPRRRRRRGGRDRRLFPERDMTRI